MSLSLVTKHFGGDSGALVLRAALHNPGATWCGGKSSGITEPSSNLGPTTCELCGLKPFCFH